MYNIIPYPKVTFIPLHDSSVTSVTTSYRYQGMGYAFHTRTWRISVTSVQHYTLPEKFCYFCTTFIPLPDSSVTSVTNLIPYRKYPYPTEHNLLFPLVRVAQTGVLYNKIAERVDAYPLSSGYVNEAYNMRNHMLVLSRCFVRRTTKAAHSTPHIKTFCVRFSANTA